MGPLGGKINRFLYGQFALLSRISAAFPRTHTLNHARFAHMHELSVLQKDLVKNEASLLIGETHFNQVLAVKPTRIRRELGNLLVVAPTRGGKGLLATSQLLTWPHSVIVNDIKGELFAQTAGYRSRLGPVFVIDPGGIGHRYDPLHGRNTEDELFSLATHILFKPDEEEGAIFTQRATAMLTQPFCAARAEGLPPLPYVAEIIPLGLAAAAERLNQISPLLATKFLDVSFTDANFSDRFLLSAWGTLTARMRPLLTETVIRSLSSSDFRPWSLMLGEIPYTVYLRIPERDLLALSPLTRLLWGSWIDDLITTYDSANGRNCKPVLLLVDEAGRTAIPSLADHATTVVGRGISLWIAIQSLSQLDAVYGKARAEIILGNMETQIFSRPADKTTAEYLEDCLGRRSGYAHSQTVGEGKHTSEGLLEQATPVMTAWDIRQMKDREIIAFHRNLPPFRARRMDWRRFAELVQRRRPPPPQLDPLPHFGRLSTATWENRQELASLYDDPDLVD